MPKGDIQVNSTDLPWRVWKARFSPAFIRRLYREGFDWCAVKEEGNFHVTPSDNDE